MASRCVCGCGRRAVHQHHAVYRQHILGAELNDPRNLVPIAFDCHLAHHGASKRLPLSVLPDGVFEFAAELMGPGAHGYLSRYYAGSDPRLDALLEGVDV